MLHATKGRLFGHVIVPDEVPPDRGRGDVLITYLPFESNEPPRYIMPNMYGPGTGVTIDDIRAIRDEEERLMMEEWDELEGKA
ncbi:MAG TPA: hypothetical protein VF624_04055 [Tepidisphaeraceae bacterium]|jgi:hypothetical protein